MKPGLPLLLLLPLTLHASEDRHNYHCDNGSRLAISFTADADGRPQATLHFADGDLHLPQVASAAGSRYRRDPIDLQQQGDEVVLADGHANRRHCSRNPPAAAGFVEIAGSVSYRSRSALPANAELVVLVRSGRLTLAEQRYRLAGAPGPIPFTATVDRDLLRPGSIVAARIEVAGQPRFSGERRYATGQAAPLMIELQPTARPRGK